MSDENPNPSSAPEGFTELTPLEETDQTVIVKYVNAAGIVERAEVLGGEGDLLDLRVFGAHPNDVTIQRSVPKGKGTEPKTWF